MNEYTTFSFLKTHPKAILPTRAHSDEPGSGNSGYDVYAVEDVLVPARGTSVVPVGLTLADLPKGVWIRIESRSGLAFKHNITAFNGIIDNNYRGDLGVKLFNFSDVDYQVLIGDRIAQLVLYPLVLVKEGHGPKWSEEASETDRGSSGHGSTGR
jgi:dUTP pyrophosphatase